MKKKIITTLFISLMLCGGIKADNTAMTYGITEGDYDSNIANAKAGEEEAMLVIAKCYETGTGVKKDLKQAWIWYG
ncbi:MAG: SEL1-like repeat protein, partial [Muribaculaceae bacterium]|nr:SEL1-like repeat protein [Muribaculaceae bacterium]